MLTESGGTPSQANPRRLRLQEFAKTELHQIGKWWRIQAREGPRQDFAANQKRLCHKGLDSLSADSKSRKNVSDRLTEYLVRDGESGHLNDVLTECARRLAAAILDRELSRRIGE